MLDLNQIIRPSILKLKAYSSARSLTKNLNALTPESSSFQTSEQKIYLDANENFQAPELFNALPWESELNRYPSPQPDALLKRFSKIYDVDVKNILITRGSDEAIDILTRSVIEPDQDSILIQSPTYGMYQVSNNIQNGITLDVPLIFEDQKWRMDYNKISKTLKDKKVKIFYICNPNNPTGTLFSKVEIERCLELLPSNTLLVLDQAYIEFTAEPVNFKDLNHPQLVILRTLSKSWGLAGLRLGCLIANPELVEVLKKVIAPYPIPTAVSKFALEALSDFNFSLMKDRVNEIVMMRENLKNELLSLSCVKNVFMSATNFLLVEFKNTEQVMNKTLNQNIVIRDRSSAISNCIRITVGSEDENNKLLQCLVEI